MELNFLSHGERNMTTFGAGRTWEDTTYYYLRELGHPTENKLLHPSVPSSLNGNNYVITCTGLPWELNVNYTHMSSLLPQLFSPRSLISSFFMSPFSMEVTSPTQSFSFPSLPFSCYCEISLALSFLRKNSLKFWITYSPCDNSDWLKLFAPCSGLQIIASFGP